MRGKKVMQKIVSHLEHILLKKIFGLEDLKKIGVTKDRDR